ncbi:MAG: hypothetical protein OXN17_18935 [Candidatus Poribacteria bacterium]|nr:hypothetical protein [Candidatus Poribacteria bacterium]MDE0506269.1 hypothetical protein [Candidatus Poribacteria bacterium]
MKIYLPLLLLLFGCGEGEPVAPAPEGQALKGTFVLTKAVMHELMDVGGPDLDDPVIIRRVPTTYVYPAGTGRLELDEGTFYLDAPLPIRPLKYRGRFKVVEEEWSRIDLPSRYYKNVDYHKVIPKLVIDVFFEGGGVAPEYGRFPYEWIGDTLKLEFWHPLNPPFVYELYWTREAEL